MSRFVTTLRLAILPAVLLGSATVVAMAQGGPPPAPPPSADTPEWAYAPNPRPVPSKTPDEVRTVPGSKKSFTEAQVDDRFGPPDWYPEEHPAMPDVVAHGKPPTAMACALCHQPTGEGHPESAGLAGLPAAYIIEQMEAFKSASRTNIRAGIMTVIAKAISDDEVKAAADYFAALKPKAMTKVVEAADVPKTFVGAGGMRFASLGADAGMEPIGSRIIELPNDAALALLRDPHTGFVAYVPPGSLKSGETLVTTGGGKTVLCAACHGPALKGVGNVPPIAGRSPQYVYRQLNDIKIGKRQGGQVAQMQAVVANLSVDDMIAISAYLGSKSP